MVSGQKQLDQPEWAAGKAKDWQQDAVKEAKQAEFLSLRRRSTSHPYWRATTTATSMFCLFLLEK
jgi:hypothetical protein